MSQCFESSAFAWVFSLQTVKPPRTSFQFGLCLWFTEAVQGIPPATISKVV